MTEGKRSRKGAWVLAALAAAALSGYLWWRPIQAERALEEASLEDLEKTVQQRPDWAAAQYWRGLALQKRRRDADALAALSQAAKRAPDNEQYWSGYAGAVNALQGPGAAFSVMREFLSRHPESAVLKEQRASLLSSLQRASDGLFGAKHYEDALLYYGYWLAEEPGDARAREGWVKTLAAISDRGKAFDRLREAVKKNPLFAVGRAALAEMFLEAGFLTVAREQAAEAVKAGAQNPLVWQVQGRVLSGSDPVQAEASFQKCVDLDPGNLQARLDLAALQETNQKGSDAEKNYRQALEQTPKDPAALTQFARFLVRVKPDESRLAEADRLATKALEADPKRGDAYLVRGRIALERKQMPAAVAALQKALTLPLTEDRAEAFYALSRAEAAAGDARRASQARAQAEALKQGRLQRARAEEEAFLHPDDSGKRLAVARLYAQNEEWVKAISQFRGALALDPKNAAAQRELDALTARLKASNQLPSMALFAKMVESARSGL